MKRILGTLVFLCAISASVLWSKTQVSAWPKFVGAWFNVSYPPTFRARVGQISPSDGGKKAESAFFTSRDGSVEFYVFSPQWNGNPKDIARQTNEILLSQRTQKTKNSRMNDGSYLNQITTRWFTVRAKNRSYTRSWVDIENTSLNTRHVFGIRYRDQKSYRKYQPDYARFKSSLVQFAD